MSQSTPQGIPIRRIHLNHISDLPDNYGTTPGGTYFSTTPGGTRIIYDRSFLLKCRASPLTNTPPPNLPDIPGVTSPDKSPTKIIGKIVEESEPTVGKENGGKHRQPYLIPSCMPNPSFGYEAFPAGKSPLQQYRQRNFIQNNSLYEKACQEINDTHISSEMINRGVNMFPPPPCSPIVPVQQPICVGMGNNYSGDGMWHEPFDMIPMPLARKACPTSQLSLWRQTKLNQVMSQSSSQQISSLMQSGATQLSQGYPGLSLYRGRGRSQSLGMWPANMCEPVEKLFKTHSANPYFPNPMHSHAAAYNNYTPAYGHCYNRDLPCQYEDNANVIQ